MAIQVTRGDLTSKVQEGWKKPALAQHYGLPVAQMTKLLKDAGLTIRKFHEPKYVLVDDEEVIEDSVEAIEVVDVIEEPIVSNEDETTSVITKTVEPSGTTVPSGW